MYKWRYFVSNTSTNSHTPSRVVERLRQKCLFTIKWLFLYLRSFSPLLYYHSSHRHSIVVTLSSFSPKNLVFPSRSWEDLLRHYTVFSKWERLGFYESRRFRFKNVDG